ncbi:MAG: AAA family ATPase [Thermodesulfobacteriota bacterium]
MILRSIRVADWRCFLDQVELGPLDEGLNIIHGPNGLGKSTLFEALRRALLDGHRVTGRDIEAIRPWGRSLAPKVTVEFIHEGNEYRIAKQFLDTPRAVLERKETGRYQRLAEGASADEEVRKILTSNPPGRGLSRLENWGLAQVLWAPQGNLVLMALSEDLVTNVRSMLSAQVSGEGTGAIEQKIEERYLAFYTPTGKIRAGREAPRLVQLERELEKAREELNKAKSLYQNFEEISRRVEELRSQHVQFQYQVEGITKALGKARQRAEAYRALLAEKERRSGGANSAEAKYNQLRQRIDLILQTERGLAEAKRNVANLEAEAPLKAREEEDRARGAERTKAALEDARKGRKEVDDAEQAADQGRRFVEAVKARTDLDALITRIQAVQRTLMEQKQNRGNLIAPDAKVLRALRKAIKERDDAQVRLEASLITLEVVPERDVELEVVAGEKTGMLPLSSGVPSRIQGSPEVVAVISGVARLRASGPTGSVEEYRSARLEAEKKIKRLTEPYGTTDMDTLEGLAEKARQIEAAISEAETQLETLLSGKTVEALFQERNLREVTTTNILQAHPEWDQSNPDPQALKTKAEDVKQRFINRVDAAEAERDKAQSALAAACGQRETLAERIKDGKSFVISLEGKLAEYTNDGKQAKEREAELGALAMAWDAAKARLAEIEKEMESYRDDPIAATETLERQLKSAKDSASEAREKELREETRLEGISAQGPYSLLAVAEERVLRLEEEANRERLRMEAIRVLRETVTQCKAEVIASVAEPVETAATRIFQRIASPRLGRIRIGEAFQPAGVVPDAENDAVSLDNLSGGEQEQLYLATRLALADVLGKEDRQLVVLDDVLTATDTGRSARVMNVIEEAAQRLQILILTCHPERYRGLKTGHFYDLEALSLQKVT